MEAKWFSDLSTKVSNEQERNQLARVIENALTFQSADGMPSECFVVLLTPKRFRDRDFGSRPLLVQVPRVHDRPESIVGRPGGRQ